MASGTLFSAFDFERTKDKETRGLGDYWWLDEIMVSLA
jgi:hypothetical protein